MAGEPPVAPRATIICLGCERPLRVRLEWAGREVRCPCCSSTLRVPRELEAGRIRPADPPSLAPHRCFVFPCPACECLLEAHTGMSGQSAGCPTCGARLLVPEVAEDGMPQPAELIEGAPAAVPEPIHAYAASGRQAPRIVRDPGGQPLIECPQCRRTCAIDSNACPSCGTPFVIEDVPTVPGLRSARYASASFVAGLLSLPLCWIFVPGLLAILLGLWSLRDVRTRRATALAAAGTICGAVSVPAGLALLLR